MKFLIGEKGESPAQGMRRVLRGLARRSRRDVLRVADDPWARIHRIRTDMKRLRALLRMLDKDSSGPSFPGAWRAASELKDVFAASRDAAVQAELKAGLSGKTASKKRKERAPAKPLRIQAEESVQTLIESVDTLAMSDVSGSFLCEALDRTFDRCADTLDGIREKPTHTDHFHDWRKQVKELGYQSQILRQLHPDAIQWFKTARTLGSLLGREHDLGVFLSADPKGKSAALAKGEIQSVREEAIRIGTDLFRRSSRAEEKKPG